MRVCLCPKVSLFLFCSSLILTLPLLVACHGWASASIFSPASWASPSPVVRSFTLQTGSHTDTHARHHNLRREASKPCVKGQAQGEVGARRAEECRGEEKVPEKHTHSHAPTHRDAPSIYAPRVLFQLCREKRLMPQSSVGSSRCETLGCA